MRQGTCRSAAGSAASILILASMAMLVMGSSCGGPRLPVKGSALFLSPQTNPVTLSSDGSRLYVANTTSGTVTVLDVSNPASPVTLAEIPVGMDPVAVAERPGGDHVYVTNHVSDSISVIDTIKLDVVQTLQDLDADGVSTTNEPVGIAFASDSRAFVTLDHGNEVLVLDVAPDGTAGLNPARLPITNQAPRAAVVTGGRLYVAAFESFNQTEFPTCSPDDDRGLDLSNPWDQGCEFSFDNALVGMIVGSPNIGGRVIIDRDLPDRDLFVFDTASLAQVDVVESVGTLLYGMASAPGGSRLYVTNTDARNHLNGLAAMQNRAFDNRISYVDCGAAGCGAPVHRDLDASAGIPLATPYGVAVSANGAQVVVSAAGSDGVVPGPSEPGVGAALPGVAVLDADGHVLGSLPLGALPQGVALRSAPDGNASVAYVLNTGDNTISVVDVSDPANPSWMATVSVGSDPTPERVRRGRIAFSTARGSTSGTFSCASCHPDGNMDQLLWTINTVEGPDDPIAVGEPSPEPRTTMPIRGVRDTLPLHWDGSLADPLAAGPFVPGDTAPDCDLDLDGEEGCVRHLVDASLSGVMCEQIPECPVGPSGIAGSLGDAERDDMAAFLVAVSYPPSPERAPSDGLTAEAVQGVSDFYTPLDGIAGPGTCANEACHALPLTVDTNTGIGGFDAPTIRGLWDRSIIFSNGFSSSEEALQMLQDCANGVGPSDPCDNIAPSFDYVWDPAVGMTEFGTLMGSFNPLFTGIYGVPGPAIWKFINEMSVGLPGLAGRQVELTEASVDTPTTAAALTQVIQGAIDGKVTAVARNAFLGSYTFAPATGLWTLPSGFALSTEELEDIARAGERVVTVTAELPGQVRAGTAFQPLIWPDPGTVGGSPGIPVIQDFPATFTLAQAHVKKAATVLVNGVSCGSCTVELIGPDVEPLGPSAAPEEVAEPPKPTHVQITLDPEDPLPGGLSVHVIQLLNPAGLATNELPLVVL